MPLSVRSVLVLQAQLFLLFHPVGCRRKSFKPRGVTNITKVGDNFIVDDVAQLHFAAQFQLETSFDVLDKLALELIGNRNLQMQVKLERDRSPTLFDKAIASVVDLMKLLSQLAVVQRVELFHDGVGWGQHSVDSLLFIKPSIQLLASVTTPSPAALHIYRGFRFHSHSPGYQVEVFLQLAALASYAFTRR